MQQEHTAPIIKSDLKNFLVRLGKIFSNISIFALVLCFCGILSFIATAFILLIGFIIILLSIGTIFAVVPNYFDILMSASKISANISDFFLQNFYIFVSIAVIGAIASLVLLLLDKKTKHTARIVVSSAVIAVALISIIVVATGVVAWKQ